MHAPLTFLAILALALPGALRAEAPLSYDACLDALAAQMVEPLAEQQAKAGPLPLTLAVAGVREQASGQRSPFCDSLEADVAKKLGAWTKMRLLQPEKVKAVLEGLEGPATDLGQPATAALLCQRLPARLLVSGSYELLSGTVIVALRLLDQDGSVLWLRSGILDPAALVPETLNLTPHTRPLSYVPPALPVAPVSLTATAVAVSPTASLAAFSQAPVRARLDPSDFSWYRFSLGAGYKGLRPLNGAFRALTGDIRAFYLKGSWADAFNAEFDTWAMDTPALPDIRQIHAYAVSLSATLPWRLGPFVVLYAGLGGRFESIQLDSPLLPSGLGLYFGNNSAQGLAGARVHRGPVGLDAALNYDFAANDSPYLSFKLGACYEFDLL